MRRRLRPTLAVTLALVCLAAARTAADEVPAATMDVLREKVRADKKVVVAVALDLTDAEAKSFWPVYGAYQSDMITHYDRLEKLLATYRTAYRTLDDDTATKLLGEFVTLEGDHAALLKRYLPQFQRVLPPKKVARLYQVENKIRALLSYELARDIPLAQ